MDPATIGLLISIAPTVLELLFGHGQSDIKHETMPKKMYGYGLEGYGYRYPPIEEYYEEPIVLGTVSSGPRKGLEIKRYPPKIDKRWVATYLLNKQYGANKWREYAKKYLQAASQEYFEKEILPLKQSNPEAFARAILNKKMRKAKKDKLPLALRTAEGRKLYEELLPLEKDKAKLREIYYGKPKKERKRKALPEEEVKKIIQQYEGLQLEEPVAKK